MSHHGDSAGVKEGHYRAADLASLRIGQATHKYKPRQERQRDESNAVMARKLCSPIWHVKSGVSAAQFDCAEDQLQHKVRKVQELHCRARHFCLGAEDGRFVGFANN